VYGEPPLTVRLSDSVTIIRGDCRDVLPTLRAVDMVLTDPPYGMGRFTTDTDDFMGVVGPALTEAATLLPDGGSLFAFTSTAEVINLGNAVHGIPFKRMLWMYKPADCTYPLHGWLLKSEAILWFMRPGLCTLADRKPYRHDCYLATHIGQEGVEGHPTVKPLSVIKDLSTRCPKDGLVLDPFMGSGTTGVACIRTGRRFVGIEIDAGYFEVARQRLENELAQGCLELT
jgi:DNA modification methylase